MAGTITMKRNDTRPVQHLTLQAVDDSGTIAPVDLTSATAAVLHAKANPGGVDTFSSNLAFASDRTTGVVIWTPVAGDTDTSGLYDAEVQITWSDGGIETFPNDGFGDFEINPEIADA